MRSSVLGLMSYLVLGRRRGVVLVYHLLSTLCREGGGWSFEQVGDGCRVGVCRVSAETKVRGVTTERGRVSGKATTEVKDGRSWQNVSEWIEKLPRRCEMRLAD